jgi:integrase
MDAIKKLRLLTGAHPSKRLFIAPQTQEPIVSDQAPARVWRKVLRKSGIRYRKPYNTRHTYATLHLMSGVNPALIAKQLGNSIIMVTTVYSKWITSEQDQEELGKVDSSGKKAYLAPKKPQGLMVLK